MTESGPAPSRAQLARLLRRAGLEPAEANLAPLERALPSVEAMRAAIRRDRHRAAEPMQVFVVPDNAEAGDE